MAAGGPRQGAERHAGYWRQPELTAKAFDEEGFYKFGDALKPADPMISMPASISTAGLPGFQLASAPGQCRPVAGGFVGACAPLVRDVVIAGLNRDHISALVVLDLDGCRLINPGFAVNRHRRGGQRYPWCARPSRTLHAISPAPPARRTASPVAVLLDSRCRSRTARGH